MTRLTPLAGYVVVKREDAQSQTASGFVLTQDTQDKLQRGEVVAVGPGKEGKQPQVQVGQTVIFKKYGPTDVDVDGQELLILEEDDIFGILQ